MCLGIEQPLSLFTSGNRIGVSKYEHRKYPHNTAYSSILGRWFYRPINSSFEAYRFRLQDFHFPTHILWGTQRLHTGLIGHPYHL